MNKFITSLLAFVFLSINQINSFAQDKNKAKTLFGNKILISNKDIGLFIAPGYGFTQMDRSATSLFFLRGGITLKNKLSLGAFFNSSLNEIKPQSEILPNIYMDYWTVGGFAEYTLFSKKITHLTFPLYVGYGEVQMDNENGNAGLGEVNFFKIEPSALLEVNIHQHVRFNIGAGYRIIGQMNYRNFNQADISGLTGYIGLKFGLFK